MESVVPASGLVRLAAAGAGRWPRRTPPETLAAASPIVTSPSWVVSHLLCTLAFVLLVYGVLTLYTCLATTPVEPRAFRAMVLSLAGIALILPMPGVETYILPSLAKLYSHP